MTLAQMFASLSAALTMLTSMQAATPVPHTDAAFTNSASVQMFVGTSTYEVAFVPGETLFTAMQKLASSTSFRFAYRTYPGLGAFVTAINGVGNAHGHYWILYADGVSSAVGVSALVLHSGDRVEWKYENSY